MSPFHILLVVRWMVKYIQDKVLRMWGLQILVCCSCYRLMMRMEDPYRKLTKLEDCHRIQY